MLKHVSRKKNTILIIIMIYLTAIEKPNKSEIFYFIEEVNKENDNKETPLHKGICNLKY